jgi:hypothetical protein
MNDSAYLHDRRVRWVSQYHAVVTADDTYDVTADTITEWVVTRGFGSRAIREANIRSRAEAEAFAARNWWGPYRSADEAITAVLKGQLRRTSR